MSPWWQRGSLGKGQRPPVPPWPEPHAAPGPLGPGGRERPDGASPPRQTWNLLPPRVSLWGACGSSIPLLLTSLPVLEAEAQAGSQKVGPRAWPCWMCWLGTQAALELCCGGGAGRGRSLALWGGGPFNPECWCRRDGPQSAPRCLQPPQPQGAAVLAGTPSPGTWEACKLQTGGQGHREGEGEAQVGPQVGLELGSCITHSQMCTPGRRLGLTERPSPPPPPPWGLQVCSAILLHTAGGSSSDVPGRGCGHSGAAYDGASEPTWASRGDGRPPDARPGPALFLAWGLLRADSAT